MIITEKGIEENRVKGDKEHHNGKSHLRKYYEWHRRRVIAENHKGESFCRVIK